MDSIRGGVAILVFSVAILAACFVVGGAIGLLLIGWHHVLVTLREGGWHV